MGSGNEDEPEKNINWPTTGMDSLPRELAHDILSRLSITSLMRFRFVSPSCQYLSHDPHLANLHLSRQSKTNNPCLIFRSKYPVENQLHFAETLDLESNIVRKIQTPFSRIMSEFVVLGSCNGLLCLSDSNKNNVLLICNPFTKNYIVLPESMQIEDQKVVVGFGYHPLTNEYKVVKIAYYQNVGEHPRSLLRRGLSAYEKSIVEVYTLGSNDWRRIEDISYQLKDRPSGPVLVNGRLHWATCGRADDGQKIISFDLSDEQFREVQIPDSCRIRRCTDPLVVLGDCLSLVIHCSYRKLEIWVMKEYNVRESWIKDFEIDVNGQRHVRFGRSTTVLSLVVQVLCLTKNGKILFTQYGRKLASYDPDSGDLKNVTFEGMPDPIQIVVLEGSVAWI